MTPTRRLSVLIVPVAVLLLATLACGPATPVVVVATPTPAMPTATPEAAGPTAVPPTVAPPTQPPGPEPTTAAGCTLGARWVADVTVPDNTAFAPGTPFVKTWRVRNSGTCAWEPGIRLVFISGEPMGGPAAVDVPALAPGAQTDVSVSLVAPAAPGTYRANYQFQAPDGTRFGAVIWAQIVVPAPATAPPPTEVPTEAPTATPTVLADLVITNLTLDTTAPTQGVPMRIIATIRNQGGSPANNFRWAWRACAYATCPYIEGPDALTLAPGAETTAQLEYTYTSWANYTTDAIADSRNEIAESDEGNNGRQLVIPVRAGRPDLSIPAVEFRPPTPAAGATFAIDIRITNSGFVNASNFTVRAVRQARGTACPGPGMVLFDRRFSVDAGDTRVFSENARIDDPGDYSICVILDHMNEVTESNEGNNTFQRDITVAGLPDLYPFYIGLNTWNPRANEDVWTSITLRNGGNSPVPNFNVRLLQQSPGAPCPGPGLVLFDAPASLEANGSMVFGRTVRFSTAGTYQLCVVLDHMNRVAESNEGNNAIRSDQNVVVRP